LTSTEDELATLLDEFFFVLEELLAWLLDEDSLLLEEIFLALLDDIALELENFSVELLDDIFTLDELWVLLLDELKAVLHEEGSSYSSLSAGAETVHAVAKKQTAVARKNVFIDFMF
jgi:hypothetical protein